MQAEFGCGSCFQGEAAVVWRGKRFSQLANLIDESHFMVNVVACRLCDQRYVRVFMETVDWVNSDDARRWVLVPLTHGESVELIGRGEAVELGAIMVISAGRKYLLADYPTGGELAVSWQQGPTTTARD